MKANEPKIGHLKLDNRVNRCDRGSQSRIYALLRPSNTKAKNYPLALLMPRADRAANSGALHSRDRFFLLASIRIN